MTAHFFALTFSILAFSEVQASPKSDALSIHAIHPNPVRIFQLGFNKCGSTSLYDFFSKNGVKSLHCDYGNLAEVIWENYINNRQLLSGAYRGFFGFFDMEACYHSPPIYIPLVLFREIDRQYPGSKFILNTRSKSAWLTSRSRHRNPYGVSYLELMSQKFNLSKEKVLKMWSEEWDSHHEAVISYFKDRPEDLLIYDIEKDRPEKICEFFKSNFKLDPKRFGHKNKTILK